MICQVTKKEGTLLDCARMILFDQCPPDNKHYLCMEGEDDAPDCALCWDRYLHGVASGMIEMPKRERGVAV